MGCQLMPQLVVFSLPVQRIARDEKCQESCPLDMTKILKTATLPFVRPLDDARYVRHHERPVIRQLHDTQVRSERRERIIRTLRSGRRDHGEQSGLAGIGLAHEAYVGDQLEL